MLVSDKDDELKTKMQQKKTTLDTSKKNKLSLTSQPAAINQKASARKFMKLQREIEKIKARAQAKIC